jgi:uncharacterized membrane protein
MRINRTAIKHGAKMTMSNNNGVYLAALIIIAVAAVFSYLSNRLTGLSDAYIAYFNERANGIASDASLSSALDKYMNMGSWTWIYLVAITIFQSVLSTGFSIYALRLCRGEDAKLSNLLDGFGIILRLLGLFIVMYIFTYLWTILLIIPGIIASYRYRLALYLLIEHPEYRIMKCIRESKRLMRGRKGELFVLDLTFIGWSLLTSIPFVGYVVSLYVTPYRTLTYINYYIAVKNLDEREQPSLS